MTAFPMSPFPTIPASTSPVSTNSVLTNGVVTNGTATSAVLVVTGDATVADLVHRLAVVVGIDCEMLAPARCTAGAWLHAPLVVVGADALDAVDSPLPPRSGVVVVTAEGESAQTWERALALGARDVISLPQGEGWLIARMAAIADEAHPPGSVVAVVGASGGVGASTLAVAFAREVARHGRRCALVDADGRGGGLDLIAGCENAIGPRWPDLDHARGRLAPASLADALLRDEGVALLSHGRRLTDVTAEAMTSVVDAARRGHDLVVLDVPRHAVDDAVAGLVDGWVLVVANRLRSVSAATALLPILRRDDATPVRLVVREHRQRASIDVIDIERTLGVDALVTIGDDTAVAAAVENGDPWPRRGALASAAGVLAHAFVAAGATR